MHIPTKMHIHTQIDIGMHTSICKKDSIYKFICYLIVYRKSLRGIQNQPLYLELPENRKRKRRQRKRGRRKGRSRKMKDDGRRKNKNKNKWKEEGKEEIEGKEEGGGRRGVGQGRGRRRKKKKKARKHMKKRISIKGLPEVNPGITWKKKK